MYRSQVKSSHSYPDFETDNDHILVATKCDIKFKKFKTLRWKKWCLNKLQDSNMAKTFRDATKMNEGNSVWGDIKHGLEILDNDQ